MSPAGPLDVYPLSGYQFGTVLAGLALAPAGSALAPAGSARGPGRAVAGLGGAVGPELTVRLPGAAGAGPELRARLVDVVDRHATLRTRMELGRLTRPVQIVDPTGTADRIDVRDDGTDLVVDLALAAPCLDPYGAAALADRLAAAMLAPAPARVDQSGVAATAGNGIPTEPPAGCRDLVALWRPAGARLRALADQVADTQPVGDPAGARVATGRIDTGLARRLRTAAAHAGVRLADILLAAHLHVVGRYTGRSRIGTWLAVDARAALGLPADTVGELRVAVPVCVHRRNPRWAELIRQVAAGAELTGRLPELVDLAPDGSGTAFAVHEAPAGSGSRGRQWTYREGLLAPYSLILTRLPDGDFGARLHHRDGDADAALDDYLAALAQLAADPDGDSGPTAVAVSAPAVPGGAGAAGRGGAVRSTAPFVPVHEAVFAVAESSPDAVAVITAGEGGSPPLTYADLRSRALAVAARLVAAGVRAEQPVGVYLPRSADLVVALLGTLAAGATAVPIAGEYPPLRGAAALREAGAVGLLTISDPGLAELVFNFRGPVWNLADTAPATDPPVSGVHRAQVAYTLFTSGSTGRPKGVQATHAGLANLVAFSGDRLGIGPGTRVAQRTPVAFDAGLWEIFAPLGTGATLVVLPPQASTDPEVLAQEIERHRVEVLQIVPALLSAHVEAGVLARCPSLRQLLCGGEPLPAALARAVAAQTSASIVNVYGPTEVTVDATWSRSGPGAPGGTVPIGRPVSGVHGYVLDELGQPVPAFVPGELYLGGIQLARGYAGQPGLTADRFVPDHLGTRPGERLYRTGDLVRQLADGELQHLGRLDDQVKLRGIRSEPAEVEQCLASCAGVHAAAVTVGRGANGEAWFAGHLVVDDPAVIGPGLREELRRRLPEPMIPAVLRAVPALPLLPNGKVDRVRLAAEVSRPVAGYQPPAGPDQERLATLCAAILGLDAVGVHDDLTGLGLDRGHALRLLAALAPTRDQPSRLGFRTVAELARALRAEDDSAHHAEDDSALRAEGEEERM